MSSARSRPNPKCFMRKYGLSRLGAHFFFVLSYWAGSIFQQFGLCVLHLQFIFAEFGWNWLNPHLFHTFRLSRLNKRKAKGKEEINLVFWRKEYLCFLFFHLFLFCSQSRSTQPRRGCVDRGNPSYLVLQKEGGGESCTIDSRTAGSGLCWSEHVIRTSMNKMNKTYFWPEQKQMKMAPKKQAEAVGRAPPGCGSGFGLVPDYTTLSSRVRANIKSVT